MKNGTLISSLLVGSLLVAVACGDDEGGNPTPPDNGGSTGKNGGAPSDAGNGPGPTDGGEPPVGVGGQGGEGPVLTCDPFTGEDGCFNCPSEPAQYLNRCVDGDCVEFPNADRLPLL